MCDANFYLLNPGLFSRVSVVEWWRRAGWIFHSTCHHWICAPPLAFWTHNRPDSGLLQVSNSVCAFLFKLHSGLHFHTFPGKLLFSLRYADLSIVALSSRLDGVEQHHADK